MAKSKIFSEGTLLKDKDNRWWIVKKLHLHVACASFYTLESYSKKGDGKSVLLDHGYDYVNLCMTEVTTAERILYG